MIIFLPVLLTLFVVMALRDGTNVIVLLPVLLTLCVGAVYVAIALKDGTRKKGPSIRVLPTNPLSRQVHSALRTQRPRGSTRTARLPPPRGASASGDGGRGGRKGLESAPSPSRGATPLRPPPGAREGP